jgi:RNA polymerase sigma-70 factor, ECF subfamily
MLTSRGCQVQDEESLVRRAQQNDEQALSRLYEEYFARVYRYVAVRVGNRLDAEDITSQVFVKVVQSLPSYKLRGVPFSAWLFRIARNQVIDHVRKNSIKNENTWIEPSAVSQEDPTKLAELNMAVDELVKALGLITGAQREVIEFRFIAELSIAETAKAMGKSEGAVKALQYSGLVALRKHLSDKDDD